MKRKTLRVLVFAVLFVAVGVTTASAAKVIDVSASVHNFSTAAEAVGLPWGSSNETGVCIFCHTPHNASVGSERPLWNRADPASAWVFYNSATLTTAARPATVGTVKPSSLMCLSCHDGSIGVNRVINESNTTGPIEFLSDPTEQFIMPTFAFPSDVPGKRIGGVIGNAFGTGNLNDDHPISFSYADAVTQEAVGALHPLNDAKTAGLVFYPRNGSADHVECGTCHDPHVAYDNTADFLGTLANPSANPNYAPFLRISNTGSTMCLTCHNK